MSNITRGKRKYKFSFDIQAQDYGPQVRMTLLWFGDFFFFFFLKAFSSHLTHHSFNLRLSWRNPAVSGPEGTCGRTQTKVDNQPWVSGLPPQASELGEETPRTAIVQDMVMSCLLSSPHPFNLCEAGSGFWDVQPWPRIYWQPRGGAAEVAASQGSRGFVARFAETATQPQPACREHRRGGAR